MDPHEPPREEPRPTAVPEPTPPVNKAKKKMSPFRRMRRLERKLAPTPTRPPKYLRDDFPTSSIMFAAHHINFNTPAEVLGCVRGPAPALRGPHRPRPPRQLQYTPIAGQDLNSAEIPRFRRKPRRKRRGTASAAASAASVAATNVTKPELPLPFDRASEDGSGFRPTPPVSGRSSEGVVLAAREANRGTATPRTTVGDDDHETLLSEVTSATSMTNEPLVPRSQRPRQMGPRGGPERSLTRLRPGSLTSPKQQWVTKRGKEYAAEFKQRAAELDRQAQAKVFLTSAAHRRTSMGDAASGTATAVRTWLAVVQAVAAVNELARGSEEKRAVLRTTQWLDGELRATAATRIGAFLRKRMSGALLRQQREQSTALIVDFLYLCQLVPEYNFKEAIRRYRFSAVLIQRAARGLLRTRRARRMLLERAWHRIEARFEHERACLTPARRDVLERRAEPALGEGNAKHIEPRRDEERREQLEALLQEALYKYTVQRTRFANEERNGRFREPTLDDARKVVEDAGEWLQFYVVPRPPPMLLLSLTRRGMEDAVEGAFKRKQKDRRVHAASITATQRTEEMLGALTVSKVDTAAVRVEVRGLVSEEAGEPGTRI